MAESFGIEHLFAYVPQGVVARDLIARETAWMRSGSGGAVRGTLRCAAADEDSITMAVEAGGGLLADRPGHADGIDRLVFASTTPVFTDRNPGILIAEALHISADAGVQDIGGSTRAATQALADACRNTVATMIVAADRRSARIGSEQERVLGHGAAAVVVGNQPRLATLLGQGSANADFVSHYRMEGVEFDYGFEARWVRDEGLIPLLEQALDKACPRAERDSVHHLILAGLEPGTAKSLAGKAGLAGAELAVSAVNDCGLTGCPDGLIALADVLCQARPGDRVLLCDFGQGCDALLLEVADGVTDDPGLQVWRGIRDRQVPIEHYTQFLSDRALIEPDWGRRAERDNRTAMSAYYRAREAINGFWAGQCQSCQTVQFPRSRVCVAPGCGATDSQELFDLRWQAARVKSFTEDWLAFAESPPLMYGNVQFDCGANVIMEYTDFAPGELKTGLPVRATFRIKDKDSLRQFRRYFWKAGPVRTSEGAD